MENNSAIVIQDLNCEKNVAEIVRSHGCRFEFFNNSRLIRRIEQEKLPKKFRDLSRD